MSKSNVLKASGRPAARSPWLGPRSLRLVAIVPITCLLAYFCVGPLCWRIALASDAYPGPQQIGTPSADGSFEWLLLHGSNRDARFFQGVIERNPARALVSLSLGGIEKGPHHADPTHRPAQEILSFLGRHRLSEGIVAHSSGVLWLSEAYRLDPTPFEDLDIVWLAPNMGSNVELLTPARRLLLMISNAVAPDPLIYPFASYSGRPLDFISARYYEQLIRYMTSEEQVRNPLHLLRDHKSRLSIFLASEDDVVGNEAIIEAARDHDVPIAVIAGAQHTAIVQRDDRWLSSQPSTRIEARGQPFRLTIPILGRCARTVL